MLRRYINTAYYYYAYYYIKFGPKIDLPKIGFEVIKSLKQSVNFFCCICIYFTLFKNASYSHALSNTNALGS